MLQFDVVAPDDTVGREVFKATVSDLQRVSFDAGRPLLYMCADPSQRKCLFEVGRFAREQRENVAVG